MSHMTTTTKRGKKNMFHLNRRRQVHVSMGNLMWKSYSHQAIALRSLSFMLTNARFFDPVRVLDIRALGNEKTHTLRFLPSALSLQCIGIVRHFRQQQQKNASSGFHPLMYQPFSPSANDTVHQVARPSHKMPFSIFLLTALMAHWERRLSSFAVRGHRRRSKKKKRKRLHVFIADDITSRNGSEFHSILFCYSNERKRRKEKKLLKTTQCRDMAASNHLPCRKQSPNNPNRGKSIKGHEGEIGGKENKRWTAPCIVQDGKPIALMGKVLKRERMCPPLCIKIKKKKQIIDKTTRAERLESRQLYCIAIGADKKDTSGFLLQRSCRGYRCVASRIIYNVCTFRVIGPVSLEMTTTRREAGKENKWKLKGRKKRVFSFFVRRCNAASQSCKL